MTKSIPLPHSTNPATEVGRAWAEEIRVALQHDGRDATGGWPGTMREARQLATKYAATLGTGDRDVAARAVYAAARSHWLKRRDRATEA